MSISTSLCQKLNQCCCCGPSEDYFSAPPMENASSKTSTAPIENSSVKGLVTYYNTCWDTHQKEFIQSNFDIKRIKSCLERNNETFKLLYNPEIAFGMLEKKNVAAGSLIFVKADIHGDLKSLVTSLITLQLQGMLDEEMRCRQQTHLIFLGDYADRGDYTLQVLELLATLRLENPEQVTLLRGNHESLSINYTYCGNHDYHFSRFLEDRQGLKLLKQFYKSLPLSLYIGSQDSSQRCQYAQFTHGAFELYVDPMPILSDSAPFSQMAVPKEDKLSQRMDHLLPSKEREKIQNNIKIRDLKGKQEASSYIHNEAAATQKISLNTFREDKQLQAAKKVYGLWLLNKQIDHDTEKYTLYNWGDIAPGDVSCLGAMTDRKWKISVADVKNYFYFCSGDNYQVKFLFRGHEHYKKHYLYNGKLLISTLPVGMDSKCYAQAYPEQKDTAYVLTTAPKIKEWTKVAYEKLSGDSWDRVHISEPYNLRDTVI